MASVRKKGRYEAHDLLDEFLLNQVVKTVNVLKLCSFAKDLGTTQTEYDRITAPNTFTQDEQIHKVSSGESRISPRWGANSSGVKPTYDFAKLSQKMDEIERILTPWGARPLHSSLGPPLISNISVSHYW